MGVRDDAPVSHLPGADMHGGDGRRVGAGGAAQREGCRLRHRPIVADRGFSDDVAIAARLDVTDLVPVLADGGMFQGQ